MARPWDGAQQSLVTIRPDDSATAKTFTYYRDGSGNLTSVYIVTKQAWMNAVSESCQPCVNGIAGDM